MTDTMVKCNWCGKDCSFLAGAPEMCLNCFDRAQLGKITDVVTALAKAVAENRQLRLQLKYFEKMTQPLA